MSQPGMNFKNMKMPTVSSGMIGGVVFFIVIMVVLYYVYMFLYTSGGVQASINIVPNRVKDKTKLKNGGVIRCDAVKEIQAAAPGSPAASPASSSQSAVAQAEDAEGLTSGGQYSVTMWLSVYSTTPQTSGTGVIPLLDITSSLKTLLFLGLMPTNGTVVVHQGTDDATEPNVGTFGITPSSSSSVYSATDRCNIVNGIEYQRWVLIGIVANGRTLDVYIDGKLSRSCVYKGLNSLGVSDGKAKITVGRSSPTTGKINGVYSTTDYFNYALTPDIMWGIYQSGPSITTTGSFFANMFNTNIDLSMGTANA
jgi:hypothetical protein